MTHTADDMHDDSPVTPAPVGEVLLPCPFCGAEAYVEWNRSTGSMFSVQCTRCAAEGPINAVEADAVTAWNRRTPPSDTSGEAVAQQWIPVDYTEAHPLGKRFSASALAAAEARGVAIGLERAAKCLDLRADAAISTSMEYIIENDARAIRSLSPAHKG